MSDWFHVTSSLNRDSIQRHGLDWRQMGDARGIAGSNKPEQQGCFLCRGWLDVDWFVEMNNTGGPVDVWAVSGVEEDVLAESPEGYLYLTVPILPDRLTLVRQDIERVAADEHQGGGAGPTGSITVTFKPGYRPGER